MVRNEPTAEDSLAAMRARNRFGMAMEAMIRMIATTISNSISEKPFCFRIIVFLLPNFLLSSVVRLTQLRIMLAVEWPERRELSNTLRYLAFKGKRPFSNWE